MKQPDAPSYLSVYPIAVKLWLNGKYMEAAAAFAKNPCQLQVNGENKALHFAATCQESENSRIGARVHEAQTNAMCKASMAMWKAWPCGGPLLETNKTYMALVREINTRRDEYQKLYGVYHEQEKARRDAIRLKKFVRVMNLMEKSLEKTCLSRSTA